MKGILTGYGVILFPASVGAFVGFAHGTPAIYAIFPLLVLSWFQTNQQKEIKELKSEIRKMKSSLKGDD
ncbi:hypothetical protein VTH8203_04543 [Vibrio thalassae]|uniref:Uncharacterized protein n=1 Tax=Vibrio thalassae TaxID=1243014 RepID=A0A240ERC9_9VIBR|nr:hypothetical protein [Vibrio thalassae]SNX50869.1 hypothetical protein VTH8203_04543 [Vibrio thalassae]